MGYLGRLGNYRAGDGDGVVVWQTTEVVWRADWVVEAAGLVARLTEAGAEVAALVAGARGEVVWLPGWGGK